MKPTNGFLGKICNSLWKKLRADQRSICPGLAEVCLRTVYLRSCFEKGGWSRWFLKVCQFSTLLMLFRIWVFSQLNWISFGHLNDSSFWVPLLRPSLSTRSSRWQLTLWISLALTMRSLQTRMIISSKFIKLQEAYIRHLSLFTSTLSSSGSGFKMNFTIPPLVWNKQKTDQWLGKQLTFFSFYRSPPLNSKDSCRTKEKYFLILKRSILNKPHNYYLAIFQNKFNCTEGRALELTLGNYTDILQWH